MNDTNNGLRYGTLRMIRGLATERALTEGDRRMGRQPRSEVTRRKIIDSAVDLINEIGYPAAGLADSTTPLAS